MKVHRNSVYFESSWGTNYFKVKVIIKDKGLDNRRSHFSKITHSGKKSVAHLLQLEEGLPAMVSRMSLLETQDF